MARTKRPIVESVCKHCGCTDSHACEGGCCWVDYERSICSACLEKAVQQAIEQCGFRQSLNNQAYVRSWLEEFAGWIAGQAIVAGTVKRSVVSKRV